MTITSTFTSTYLRLELIKMQVRVLLRRTSNISDGSLNFMERILDHRCVSEVSIYGIDSRGLCRAQLKLYIDWNEYDIQIAQGKTTIAIDEHWVDNTAIELDEAMNIFNKYLKVKSLRPEWSYCLCEWASTPQKRAELGIPSGSKDAVKWANKKCSWNSSIPEIPELRIGCYLDDT